MQIYPMALMRLLLPVALVGAALWLRV